MSDSYATEGSSASFPFIHIMLTPDFFYVGLLLCLHSLYSPFSSQPHTTLLKFKWPLTATTAFPQAVIAHCFHSHIRLCRDLTSFHVVEFLLPEETTRNQLRCYWGKGGQILKVTKDDK